MGLTLLKRGSIWYLRGTVCGTAIYQSTKLTGRNLAETMRKRIQGEIEEAHALGMVERTFNNAADAYVATGGSSRFLDDLRAELGKKKLKTIDQVTLDEAASRAYPKVQPSTRNRQFYTPFIAVWNFAAENDWARPRKWRRPIRRRATRCIPTVQRAGSTPVDYETAAKFVSAMSPAPAMLMTALFYTGLRPIEAFALQAQDVNTSQRWIVVRSSKTGQPRGVPMHDWLVGWLPDLVERGGFLFKTPKGNPYRATEGGGGQLKSAIRGARERSGIKDVSPYTGRHSASTQLVVNGVHPHIKDQILGHAVDDMSRHYTNVPQAALIEAINTLPVPDAWQALPWVSSPRDWWGRLAGGPAYPPTD